jgi:hypothetical protein
MGHKKNLLDELTFGALGGHDQNTVRLLGALGGMIPGFQWLPFVTNGLEGAEHGGLKGLLMGELGSALGYGIPGTNIPGLSAIGKQVGGDLGGAIGSKLGIAGGDLFGNTAGSAIGAAAGLAGTGAIENALNPAPKPKAPTTITAQPTKTGGPTGGGAGLPVQGSIAPKVYPWTGDYGGAV